MVKEKVNGYMGDNTIVKTMPLEQPTKLVIDCLNTDSDLMKTIIMLLMDAKEAEWSWEGWC